MTEATEIRARAKRKIGELEKVPHGGSAGGSKFPSPGSSSKATALEAACISTSEAHRCEQLALIPEAEVEAVEDSIVPAHENRPCRAAGLLK